MRDEGSNHSTSSTTLLVLRNESETPALEKEVLGNNVFKVPVLVTVEPSIIA
jgi:hypothetical protein